MRGLFAVVLLVFGVAVTAPVGAADRVTEPDAYPGAAQYGGFAWGGVRAQPVWIYDYDPGVITRAWWLSPWEHRHYFPATGKRPRVGRHENLSARGARPAAAKSFYRSWSTDALFAEDRAPAFEDERVPQHRPVPLPQPKP